MMQFDRIFLGRQAKKLGFVRDTFEKVCRLADVLSFMEKDPLLSDSLALKGGTAINLQKNGLFDASQEAMLKKCTMFYAAVVSETVPEHFDFGGIRKISPQKIKTDLLFSDREVLSRIEQHPMALWKCGRKSDQEK